MKIYLSWLLKKKGTEYSSFGLSNTVCVVPFIKFKRSHLKSKTRTPKLLGILVMKPYCPVTKSAGYKRNDFFSYSELLGLPNLKFISLACQHVVVGTAGQHFL